MNLKRILPLTAAALGAAIACVPAQAAGTTSGTWEIRLRAVDLDPSNISTGGALPSNAVHINSKVLPDLDFEYFFDPNWSAELVLTYPQTQDVTVSGTAIGSFKHLPPTLTAKYNFLPNQDFQPYVGLGVNLTLISSVNLAAGTTKLDLNSSSTGIAGQVGFDYKVADHWFANVDVKYVQISSDVKVASSGAKLTTAHLNPFLIGVGVGYRF